jgi:hypothetical protein
MSFFDNLFNMGDSQQAHQAIYESRTQHHSTWTHELVSGATGFAGKIYIVFTLSVQNI